MWLRANSLRKCLGRQIVMLTEVKKKSNELSVSSKCKQVNARYSDHGFFTKWQIQNYFPLSILTRGSFRLSATATIHLWWPNCPVPVSTCMNVTRLSLVSLQLWKWYSKSSLPCCGCTNSDQIHSTRWENSKRCADGGGEFMLSFRSSLLFPKWASLPKCCD